MADRQYKIHLGFTADINQAKQQMNQLQSELDRLSRLKIKTPEGLTQGLTKANDEVLKLSILLKDCFNVDTGKLDINKLLVQSKQYGFSIEQMRSSLQAFGADGDQALQQLNAQIAQGQTGIMQLSNLFTKFGKQMVRTFSIQLSYGVMNSVLDTFRNAYSYAQDLNKSLNNIQIVTGKSNNEMRKFAVEANKAAKALSASTTAYTDAALIYYQQGLNSEEVKERTDTTIKLSNVTGQSAEEVSSYMTAIWNNFDDGSKKLEYYADVITALGAATASSSEEIARGLSQFSAVADTVGLSYEYATSALATVVAQTRQSADTVGNAFKTIFARLESLNLGETLDDDTTLTKYTSALEKVGISVQLQNGQLKNMDTILDELGSKWEMLNSQQKNGLAYTVAGARQYTNFIALMDNWNKVKENIGVASGAEGTLQDQANIYAKSWEAANKRLKASWQELYDLLINDDAFITIIESITGVINGVNSLIKSFGGLKGVLPLIIGLLGQVFSKQIAAGAVSVAGTIQSATQIIKGEDVKEKNKATRAVSLSFSNTDQSKNALLGATVEEHASQLEENNLKKLTLLQQQYNDLLQRRNAILKENAENANNAYADELELLQSLESEQNKLQAVTLKSIEAQEWGAAKTVRVKDLDKIGFSDKTKKEILGNGNFSKKTKLNDSQLQKFRDELKNLQEEYSKTQDTLIESVNGKIEGLKATYQLEIKEAEKQKQEAEEWLNAVQEELKNLKDNGTDSTDERYLKLVQEEELAKTAVQKATDHLAKSQEHLNTVTEDYANSVERSKRALDENKNKIEVSAQTVQAAVTGISSLVALGTSTNSFFKSLSEGSLTFGSALSSLVSIGGTLVFAINSVSAALKALGMEMVSLPVLGWIIGTVAVITMLIGVVNGLHEKAQQKIKDQQEEINKQNELIDSTQQLSQSISDLANEYLSLRDAGKASLETFKEIEEQLPQLIDYYKELGLETDQLELAFEQAKVTGDISNFLSEKAILDNIVASKNAVNAQENYRNGGKNMATAGTGSHSTLTNTYTKSFKTGLSRFDDQKALAILSSNEFKIGNPNTEAGQNTFNLNNADEMISYYERLQKARDEMTKSMTSDERSESEVYQDVIQELNALEESYTTAKAAANEVNQAIAYSVDTGQYESINKILGDGITSIAEYADKHDQLIETLVTEEGISEEDAEAILRLSGATEEFAKAQSAFKTMAENAAFEAGNKEAWDKYYNDLTDWYDTLENDSDRRLARLINYTAGMSADAMNAQLAELKEQQWAQEIKNTISKDELEEEDFNKYAEHLKNIAALTDTINDELKDNDAAANAVARDIMKMNRGIETLNDGYEDWIDILKKSDKASEEYSNALYDIKSALSDVYDIESKWISSSFVEKNLTKIEKAAQGDADAIEELRKELGKDIFENIKSENAERLEDAIKNATIEGIASIADLDNAFQSLQERMNGMEVGEIGSQSFIDSCNEIVAAAGMTAEQATTFFNSMGFETKLASEPQTVETKVPIYRIHHEVQGDKDSGTYDEITWTEPIGEDEYEGEVPSYAMTTDGSVPKVESIVKTSHGSMNNFSSTNNGGKSGSKSGGKSNKEADRYYTISRQVEKLNKQLDELGKKTDRAFGQSKLDAMQAEIDKYNDLIAANKEYLRQAEEWLAHDRAKMEQYGAQFDSNGVITNYEAMFAAHGNDEDGEWAKWLSHYEDSLAKVQEMQEAIAEAQRAIYDKALEAIEYKLEFSIKINDADLKYLEYILNGLEDAAYDSAEAIATLEKKIDNANKKAKALNENAVELFDIISPGNGQSYYEQMLAGNLDLQALANEKILNDPNFNAAQWFDDINNLYEQLIENQENYRQMWKDYIDMMKNFWDDWKENFDKQKKQITDLTKVASFYKDLVGILGKDELGLSDATIARLDATVSKGRLDEALISYKTFLKTQKALQEAEEKNLDDEVIEYYKEKVQEAKDELMAAQKAAAQAFVDEYNNALDRIVKNAMDAFSNIGDFDWMKKMYDLELKRNDLYMDTYEKAYQMNKLGNDITRSINEINGLKTKQELSSLLDEINAKQASGVKMSEYEYEAYRKQYELLLAIQALEDAKNAKSQVRMSRDNEGNMSYVYTADQGAIDEATDNYNDVAYQFAQLNMGQGANAEAQYLALYEQMMTEIRQAGEEHRAEIEEKYAEMLEYWKDQAEISYKWNKDLMEQMGLDYWDLTVKFEDSVLAHATGCKTWEELEIHRKETTEQALRDMADADEAYHDKVSELLDETGEDVEDMEGRVNDALDDVDEGMDETMDKVEELEDEFDDSLGEVMDTAQEFESVWHTTTQSIINENDRMIRSLKELINYYNKLALAQSQAGGGGSYGGSRGGSSGSSSGGTSGGGPSGNGPSLHTGSISAPSSIRFSDSDIDKNNKIATLGGKQVYQVNGVSFLASDYEFANGSSRHATYVLKNKNAKNVEWYNTGGYTGEWGPEGRLAMLHQKELVLNANDTANMFQIIDAVRDVTKALELQSHGANVDLSGTAAGAIAGFMNFDQNVHITAEFPNATDRNEIQAAFADLMNRATQYINRK